jgi:hypothetical protein
MIDPPSPGCGANFHQQIIVHRLVEAPGQAVDRSSPRPDIGQMESRAASEQDRVEVLVRDGVPPIDQFLELPAPALVPRIQRVHRRPELDSQPFEVGPDSAGMRIASSETAIPDELRP